MQRLVEHRQQRHPGCERVLHRRDGGHLNGKWFESFGRRLRATPWAAELGVSAHWLRHTTLTDIERIAGVRVAGAYAGHSDSSFGVTGLYTKVTLDELRLPHVRLFFDDPADAAEAAQRPQLYRRPLPALAGAVSFMST
jgi:integrase